MKNKTLKLLMLLLLFGCGAVNGQDVNLEWAKRMGGIGDDFGNSIALDASGNVYTTGYFRGTVDFDPGPGIANLTSAGNEDIFISKLDASGAFVWVKRIGGGRADYGNSITVDANGNVYTTGCFRNTVDFDPGVGIVNLTSTSMDYSDIFISKLDASGIFVWAKKMGGTSNDEAVSITVDGSGNVYTTGFFSSTVDFDPGPGIFNLTSAVSSDVFISKLDASGAFLWAKSMGGTGSSGSGQSIVVDASGNVYTTGDFQGTADFDPGPGIFNLIAASTTGTDIFISKLDASGAFLWAKQMGGTSHDFGYSIALDANGNIYTTGSFSSTVDFDPGPGIFNLTSAVSSDVFISKLDASGAFLWAKSMGGTGSSGSGQSIVVDASGNVYTTGDFQGTADFDPGLGIFNLTSVNFPDIFISKLDASGTFLWAKKMGGTSHDKGHSIAVDGSGNVYTTGYFKGTADFDLGVGIANLTSAGSTDIFVLKLNQKNITGRVYQDFNQNCVQNTVDIGLANRILIINPGNLIVTTSSSGLWCIDYLAAGNYTITADTSNNWQLTCPVVQNFTVIHPDSLTVAPSFGFVSTNPCSAPDVSIHAPFLRPGFSNQKVYVQACNQATATGVLNNAYVIVELDTLLTIQSSSQAYTSLGNNKYQVNLGTIYPGYCVDFWLNCHLSTTAILGQALCMNATLYPVDSCAFDNTPTPLPPTITPCNTPYDFSHLVIRPACNNDSISFVIENTGDGDMTCFSQVRLYIDGVLVLIDSVQLLSGATRTFAFAGDGRTWRLEVDQHPLHYGNSQPSATMELCGNAANWTSNLVNILPQNDADPIIDIYCGLVTGSYDPNDKTGYPLGINTTHDILPNQDLEYLIRFQNTGTDTAFTVVIRDTLTMDLDIFSVRSGVSSHDYTFKMYGPRVLEWTFSYIMLPDSNVNEVASHGFVTFKVNQAANLPLGTVINNSASIYFDFNAPIFTNTSQHTIALPQDLNWDGVQTLNLVDCDSYTYNNLVYNNSGTYWQVVNNAGLDSLYTLNLTILDSTTSSLSEIVCNSYTAPDAQVYNTSGQYTATITNAVGCDSIITINLTVNNTSVAISETVCNTYTAPDAQVYTSSGQYTAIIPNTAGCDSIITINLSIDNSPNNIITQNGFTLNASAGFTYQWLDCNNGNAPILGETNASFTAAGNGDYAVQITNGTCVETSTCTNITGVSTSTLQNNWGIEIYPNPTESTVYLKKKMEGEISLKLLDNLGRELISTNSSDAITVLELSNFASGVYYLYVNSHQHTMVQKIIKQ